MNAALWRLALIIATVVALGAASVAEEGPENLPEEHSFWLHASLGLRTQKNYFGPDYPATPSPTREEIEKAARVLEGYGANRLYLIYHREVPIDEARQLFTWWRESCPRIELVPALVLNMYDRSRTRVFSDEELDALAAFFHERINSRRLAIYDIAAHREAGDSLAVLARRFPAGLIRLGLQPDEAIQAPFVGAVADTWSALCHGKRTEEDWRQEGFGAGTLRKWVLARNASPSPVAWNLVSVAWDYSATERGGYPGYDDAEKNMPLPAGRNHAAAELIRQTASPRALRGFSSDLYILQENSRSIAHDGPQRSFYECLKRGEDYHGYYGAPFQEIVAIYRQGRD